MRICLLQDRRGITQLAVAITLRRVNRTVRLTGSWGMGALGWECGGSEEGVRSDTAWGIAWYGWMGWVGLGCWEEKSHVLARRGWMDGVGFVVP